MCKVSVIMPSLNVVKYIRQCMDSVVDQTLKDIEILAIDAGSTDGTAEIMQSYADKDSRIQFIHSDRKSYGYQVNLGLARARGEYVGIVETDDWLEPDAYETLYQYACRYQTDYVRGVVGYYKELTNGLSYNLPAYPFPRKYYEESDGRLLLSPREHREILLRDIYLWNGIYKRDFLQGISLNETAGAAYQDVGFLSQIYDKVKRALYIDKLVYHYRKDNEDCSCYSRNAFRYLVEEYQFVHAHLKPDDKIWRCWNDARYFYQVYARFGLMARSGSYWEDAEQYIKDIYQYFYRRQDIIPYLGDMQREGFELFIESPVTLYDFLQKKYVKKQRMWDEFLGRLENRVIVIFGSGKRGYFLQFLLMRRKIGHVLGYCDNDTDKIGKDCHGLAINSLDYWVRAAEDICFVVTARAAVVEMTEQLLANGVQPDNIVTFELPMDFSVL